LMSLLSGKQKTKKKKIPKEEKLSEKPINDVETDCDVSDNFDSSFTENRSNQLRKDFDVLELEKKIYNNDIESVSAKDFFSRIKKKAEPSQVTESSGTPTIEILEGTTPNNAEPILIDLDEENDIVVDTKSLEAKIYGDNAKRTSAKDFLRSLKPVPKKTKREPKSYFVTLKINPGALKEIKNYDNPFKTKGNISFQGTSRGSIRNEFFDRPKVAKKSVSSNSFFDSMMKASKNTVKLTPLQKLKELEPPIIQKSQFHVCSSDDLVRHNDILACLPPRVKAQSSDYGDNNINLMTEQSVKPQLVIRETSISKLDLLKQKIPDYHKHTELRTLVEKFILIETNDDNEIHEITQSSNTNSQLWTDLFYPDSTKQLLIAKDTRNSIKNWILNSFSRLKAQNLRDPRNVLIKKKKKKQKNLDNFIVDDYSVDFDNEETEEEIFVPLLILQGSIGSGKSSSIYAVTKELNSYVHEINTGLNRGRKDIFNSLKEFCTTQLVHRQDESRTFQQGIVLLEDVNILFEQDKNFWSVVQDILNISRRPIVITCETLLNIPKSLLEFAGEEGSIIHMDQYPVQKQLIKSYIWICGLTQGFDMKSSVLEKILRKSSNGYNYDLRKCLMEAQFICQSNKSANKHTVVEISLPGRPKKQGIQDLESHATLMDILSCGEVISGGYHSMLNHEVQENELVDIYHIDDTTRITQEPLPFELNIGEYLIEKMREDYEVQTLCPSPRFSFNTIREEVSSFIGSRSKKRPKFFQDLAIVTRTTRSQNIELLDELSDSPSQDWAYDTTGVPETSFLNYILPSSLTLDVLPLCRNWIGFQIELDKIEQTTKASGGASVKEFLNYRDFQKDSTILLDTL
ncbi:uncharacterized protein CANTADRAFT_27862, partial [Suhomyces tanzawaensis NRRL Y-17324]